MSVFQIAYDDHDRFHAESGKFLQAFEGAGTLADSTAALQGSPSSLEWIKAIPAASAAISGTAIIGGATGVAIGGLVLRNNIKHLGLAIKTKDYEGVAYHGAFALSSFGYTAISGVMFAEGVMGFAGTAIAPVVGNVFGGIGLAMYGALGTYAAIGLKNAHTFSKELAQHKKEGPLSTLKWLEKLICHQPGETSQDLRKKWSAFERRTNPECAKMVRDELGPLLQNFNEEKAKDLIQKIEKSNVIKKVKFALLIAISLVGLGTFVCMLVFTGPISTALFACGAILWLAIDSPKLNRYIGEKYWVWHNKSQVK